MWQALIKWTCAAAVGAIIGVSVEQTVPPAQPAVVPVATGAELGIPFDRYETLDSFGRTVTYYLSKPPATDPAGSDIRRPLVVVIQGSGCSSIWQSVPAANLASPDQASGTNAAKPRIGGGLQNLIRRDFGGEVRVLAVEKPGVRFLDNPHPPGTGDPCADEFKNHHTPPEWSAAISASLRESLRLPGVDPSRVLVLGHSEGADMAAYVAQANPDIVTHVACLAGAGITQLFDMTQLAWAEQTPGESLDARTQRVQSVYDTWAAIQRDPAAIDKSAWGHPYKRWSSFAAISPVESLLATDPRQQLFLAHGTADQAVPIASFDAGLAILASKGRTAVVRRLPGLDHGFAAADEQDGAGMARIMGEAVTWFLKNQPTSPDASLLAPTP
ncbi:MAG TPA: hypothetical protein VK157_12420 [Phycisphaerales bacterium]|nr:hypothetical protein [Phycisphaerales bacterium]